MITMMDHLQESKYRIVGFFSFIFRIISEISFEIVKVHNKFVKFSMLYFYLTERYALKRH
uniref:Uncharacterized protein n=1 Tax=Wuchereria bancrofti TaxID=6293 RepID=A0AAF5RVX5_WUCBA